MFTVGGNLSLVSAVGGVVLEHVDHVVQRDEGIVDSDHLNFIDMKFYSSLKRSKLVYLFTKLLYVYY
jgi:hypothetical protein